MKSPHMFMMTFPVLLFLLAGGILLAQQQSDVDATRTDAQAGSVNEDLLHRTRAAPAVECNEDSVKAERSEPIVLEAEEDVRQQKPATRLVESIEHGVKVVRSEPVVVQAKDSEDAEELVGSAADTEQTARTPLVVTPPVQAERYSYRSAVEDRSTRAWAYHPHSFAYQPTRYRTYTPKRDWTYHPTRFRRYVPKRDWSYRRP